MGNYIHTILNRRELLHKIGRTTSLAGISLAAMYIYGRNTRRYNADSPAEQGCNYNYLCSRCNLLSDCQLPAAYKARQARAKHG